MDKKGNFFTKAYGPVGKGWIINRSICMLVIIALIVVVNIGTNIAYEYKDQLNAYLLTPIVDTSKKNQAQAAAAEMAKKVEANGATLLKNADNVLPLSKTEDKKVNIFGFGSVDWGYGGLGNGTSAQASPETGNVKDICDLTKALTRYGISYNKELQDFYKNWCEPLNGIASPNTQNRDEIFSLREPPFSKYSQTILDNAKAYSNVAIVVLTRFTAESRDADNRQLKAGPGQSEDKTRHYLEISTEEEDMLKWVGKNFEKTIVLINSGNIMECSFMDTIEGLDACVYVGLTGTQAAAAIPKLLWGDEQFSGKLVDSVPYSFDYSPASYATWFQTEKGPNWYGVDYIEGIYVGYKWYETAAHDGVYDSVDNTSLYGAKAKGYYGIMQYPFGFGLTYTDFEWTVKSVKSFDGEKELTDNKITENTTFEITVEVKNIGEQPGKDVVEAYVTVPYTKGGIEKSYVSLVGYAKTETIMPGATQEVTVKIDAYDFISYDCYDKNNNGFKGYELEEGDYEIKLQTDSHNVKKAILPGKTAAEDAVFTFNVAETIKLATDKYTGAEVKNLFTGDDAIDGFSLDGIESDYNANIPWMTRVDFKDGYQIPALTDEVKTRSLSAGANKTRDYSKDEALAWNNATTDEFGDPVPTENPTWNKDSGSYKLWEVKNGKAEITELGLKLGANADDPDWDKVLDSITYAEAGRLIGPGMNSNAAVASVGKVYQRSYDSMIQVKGFAGLPRGTGNPSTIVLAMCWSEKLAYEYATNFANEMITCNVKTIFAPGVNIHRSPFGGRNWEYFSEDTYLTTLMGCTLVRGLQNYGCGVEIKHFALNEKESTRTASSWLTEQALRETYLKPFHDAVVKENVNGIMSAYSFAGAQWTGGSVALLTGVLRKEWKFNGYVDTDWTTGMNENIDEQLRAGGDLGMASALSAGGYFGAQENAQYVPGIADSYKKENATPRLQWQIRNAVKHILYGFTSIEYQKSIYVPSEDEAIMSSFTIDPWEWWKPAITCLNLAVYFGCAIWLVALFMPTGKKQSELEVAYAGEQNEKEGN